VNGKTPRESLSPWLLDGANDADGPVDLPDIYVVGYVTFIFFISTTTINITTLFLLLLLLFI